VKECICIDLETAGLNPTLHEVVEVSWWCLDTGERDTFVPSHSLEHFEGAALDLNGYYERGLWQQSQWDEDGEALRRFHAALTGRLIVGSNPGFDVSFLKPLFTRNGLGLAPLAYHPLDVPTYACGVLGRPIADRVGLTQLARILGVAPGDHSAAEDVRACGECLIELQNRANYLRTGQ
jgi:DNA polymerase III epsilon subunit-like protein